LLIYNLKTDDDDQERGILHLKNCRLKKNSFKDETKQYFGFILMAKGLMQEFYTNDREETQEWIE
jgi:hypothetical protein